MSSDSLALYLSHLVCAKKTHYACWNGNQCYLHLDSSISNPNLVCVCEATNTLLLQPSVRMQPHQHCLPSSLFTLSWTHQGSITCNLALAKMRCTCPDSTLPRHEKCPHTVLYLVSNVGMTFLS